MRVVEPDRLHRPVAQGVDPALGHDLDRHAALEVGGVRLPLLEHALLAVEQPLVERQVLLLVHRAVDVVLAALVPPRGHPAHIHVDAVVVHDRAIASKNARLSLPVARPMLSASDAAVSGPGGDDGQPGVGQRVHLFARDLEAGEGSQLTLHLGRKHLAVHRHRRSGGHPRNFARAHHQRVQPPHLVVQQADRVVLVVVRAEAVRADQLGQPVGLVRRRRATTPAHFRQAHADAAPGELPGGLAAGESAADDVHVVRH
jgi:hypothetical protein